MDVAHYAYVRVARLLIAIGNSMQYKTKLTFQKFWKHSKKHKVSGLVMLFFLIVAPVVNAIVPLYFKDFFDILVSDDPKNVIVSGLMTVLIIIAILELVQWCAWRINTFLATYFQTRVMKHIANDCFQYLHKHSFSYFNNNFVGSLVKRINRFTRAFEGIADELSW